MLGKEREWGEWGGGGEGGDGGHVVIVLGIAWFRQLSPSIIHTMKQNI
jgi:hypothetical protein